MSRIFRQTALDKISSPDQLDQVIVITPPSFWIAMFGAGVALLTALIWSIFGRVPVNINADGIYMTGSGIHVVYSEGNGIIEEVLVNDGAVVKEGDVIARLSDKEIKDKLEQAKSRRSEVEAVTRGDRGRFSVSRYCFIACSKETGDGSLSPATAL